GEPTDSATKTLADSGADFPELVDAEGVAFAKLGAKLLPRIYVLDAQGSVVWFDIEYSEATRRELRQAIAALTDRTDDP
ncbi:MAG: hypothetical protein AAF961_14915, partial [Planctomycetota bacterium]